MNHLTSEHAGYIVTIVLDKFYQGVGTELGKQAVTLTSKFAINNSGGKHVFNQAEIINQNYG